MNGTSAREPLGGIICPIVTPLTTGGGIDQAGLAALLRHVTGGGVDAVLVAGTTGECAALSDKNWQDLVTHAVSILAGATPAIINVSHCSPREARARADFAAQQGASFLTAMPPCYFPLDPDELVAYYVQLADASPVPLLLYNIPQYTKTDVFVSITRLAAHPNIVGIKESSGLYDRLTTLPQQVDRPFTRVIGTDAAVHAVAALGLEGAVPGLANLIPRTYSAWWRALRAGNRAVAEDCRATVAPLVALYDQVTGYAPYIRILHHALCLIGIEVGMPGAAPRPLTAPLQALVQRTLARLDIRAREEQINQAPQA
jgi:4-hydroxy-tetrahydrodipicolinate synthase